MQEFICNVKEEKPEIYYKEWLITNGLGGYACGAIGGLLSRKYHALLVSALEAPLGRTVMLNFVADSIILPDQRNFPLFCLHANEQDRHNNPYLVHFKLENFLPTWVYQIENIVIEKKIWMAHGQNTVYIQYHLLSADFPLQLQWRPYLHFRSSEEPVNAHDKNDYQITSNKGVFEISTNHFPSLKILNDHVSHSFMIDFHCYEEVFYILEKKRGYESIGNLKSPGFFSLPMNPDEKVTFIASTAPLDIMLAMSAEESLIADTQRKKSLISAAKPLSFSTTMRKLVLAADQFIMSPIARKTDRIRLKAMGEELCSIIAGYPWFTDWGRDTMISLEGLTLVTGRHAIAKSILRTFAYYIKDGLIPNMFPDGENHGLYHTADATLWFFHALERYLVYTQDSDFLEYMLPKFHSIITCHIQGTHFGIKMDDDGLLMQGQEGYQLTWMDAKVGDWVVTPRRGKAVEINALWYNALKLMEKWTGKYSEIANLCYHSFNNKFWNEKEGYLYDVIKDDHIKDSALRPNQIFSLSLTFPVLDPKYWQPMLQVVKKELLTTYGLRTLSPSHPDFKAFYKGSLWDRDAAYHQGTIWPWLLGPFIDAWLKGYPDNKEEVIHFLDILGNHIDDHCIGTIAEIFDSSDPYQARGCFAQAWSVAEFLRAYHLLHP